LQSIYGNGIFNETVGNSSSIPNTWEGIGNITAAYEILYTSNSLLVGSHPNNAVLPSSGFVFDEQLIESPQSSIGFSKIVSYQTTTMVLHSNSNLQYLANYSMVDSPGFLAAIQTGNSFIQLSCQGDLCISRPQLLNRTLQQAFNISIIFSPNISDIQNSISDQNVTLKADKSRTINMTLAQSSYLGKKATINGTLELEPVIPYQYNIVDYCNGYSSSWYSCTTHLINLSYVVVDSQGYKLYLNFSNSYGSGLLIGQNYSFMGTLLPTWSNSSAISPVIYLNVTNATKDS
jgi:hypothetical protein